MKEPEVEKLNAHAKEQTCHRLADMVLLKREQERSRNAK